MFILALLLASVSLIRGQDFFNEACFDSSIVKTMGELAKVQKCSAITGSLTIDASEPLDVKLDATSIVGDFILKGDNIKSVRLDKLKSIVGKFELNAANVESVQFTELASVVDDVKIENSRSLKQASFPKLSSIVGNLKLENLEDLEKIELPALSSICGDLDLKGINKLNAFALPNMQAYEVKITIDSTSLSEVNLGKMVEKPGSSINFKNKSNLKLNTKIEKDCHGGNFDRKVSDKNGYNGTNDRQALATSSSKLTKSTMLFVGLISLVSIVSVQ